jgi:hypothetical protein
LSVIHYSVLVGDDEVHQSAAFHPRRHHAQAVFERSTVDAEKGQDVWMVELTPHKAFFAKVLNVGLYVSTE